MTRLFLYILSAVHLFRPLCSCFRWPIQWRHCHLKIVYYASEVSGRRVWLPCYWLSHNFV